MAQILPTIDLNGVNYTIDKRLRELRRTDRPWENIPFDDLKDEGDFCTIKFVKGTDNEIPDVGFGMYKWDELVSCTIPYEVLYANPVEMTMPKNN